MCALGSTSDEIRSRLLAGDQTRFTQRADLIPGDTRPFGQAHGALPTIPRELAPYDCRNSQLAHVDTDAGRNIHRDRERRTVKKLSNAVTIRVPESGLIQEFA